MTLVTKKARPSVLQISDDDLTTNQYQFNQKGEAGGEGEAGRPAAFSGSIRPQMQDNLRRSSRN